MALPILPALLSAASWFKGHSLIRIATNVALFYALKTVLVVLFTGVLAVVLHNFMIDFSSEMFQAALPYMNENIPTVVLELTGLSAWLALQLRLPEVLSVLLSALSISFVRQLLPRI
jgi:hypothetical protein